MMTNRKLDAAIANVLGWKQGINVFYYPKYSTDGNAMLELDREMQARGFMLMVEVYNEGYSASYWICHAKEWTGDYVSNNMPKAVARAAYEALTGKEWRDD